MVWAGESHPGPNPKPDVQVSKHPNPNKRGPIFQTHRCVYWLTWLKHALLRLILNNNKGLW